MDRIKLTRLIENYLRENPLWYWDFISDQYALHDFIFELMQILNPDTEKDEQMIEDSATQVVSEFDEEWENMSQDERYRFAKKLEQFGADVDYDFI